jgi:hypothetical protein
MIISIPKVKVLILPKARNLFCNKLANEKCRKLVRFATLFHTLKHGRPMLEYEYHRDLFDFLNFEENIEC